MSILSRLASSPGVYWGRGTGPHTGDFVARLAVVPADADAVVLEYEAWATDRGLQHAESAVLTREPDGAVLLESHVDGLPEPLRFREGETGVFGSLGEHRIGMVLTVSPGRSDRSVSWSWWWAPPGGVMSEQSSVTVRRQRQLPAALLPQAVSAEPAAPEAASDDAVADDAETSEPMTCEPATSSADHQADPRALEPVRAPWPGVVVVPGTAFAGSVGGQLAARLPRAAYVRSDLFDKAVRGTDVDAAGDPVLRHEIAADVVLGYVRTGHAVVVHESGQSPDPDGLVKVLQGRGLATVHVLDLRRDGSPVTGGVVSGVAQDGDRVAVEAGSDPDRITSSILRHLVLTAPAQD